MAVMSEEFYKKLGKKVTLLKTTNHAFLSEDLYTNFDDIRELINGLERDGFRLKTSVPLENGKIRHGFVRCEKES